MVGIIGAMEIEVLEIKALAENKVSVEIAGIEYVTGTIAGREVVIARCNPGKVNAAACAQIMISKYNPEIVINIGVAGSLSKELDIGEIAVANNTVHHDMDTSALGEPLGFISGIDAVEIECDKNVVKMLCEAAENAGLKYSRGTIATGDQFICADEKKAEIKKNFGAVACEMEGASVGQVCVMNKTPYGVLRAISDKADGSSVMDFPEFAKMAAANSVKIICEFLKLI